MKIFRMNDCDWWVAPTLEEAVKAAVQAYGCEDEAAARVDGMMDEEPRELAEAELDRLQFRLEEWECECGAKLNGASAQFRSTGTGWEHHHGYPIGHVAMHKTRTFREELARRVAAGAKTELFASTEA